MLAHHLLCVIQRALHAPEIRHRWPTPRTHLSGQVRVITSLINDKGQMIHSRNTLLPEPIHVEIYNALGLPRSPLKRVLSIH
ncbi:hypothetical protein SAMN02746041_01842 [Desulfacinum hydrothermale DSM 13146]|uniref:Uncharacterized protein n=1 Tax=Desulfacinum hydrothermale DSM 13146 TaxID=1121390 RepID=A0A1W1XIW8_9BACT|nr:hypothetical protein [Desulfacinum hydrothermale]SMC23772.1 hypothetical protein SAMN02746041_01842 [Desulfacinum hydrothermale DSM 13146]